MPYHVVQYNFQQRNLVTTETNYIPDRKPDQAKQKRSESKVALPALAICRVGARHVSFSTRSTPILRPVTIDLIIALMQIIITLKTLSGVAWWLVIIYRHFLSVAMWGRNGRTRMIVIIGT